MRVWSGQAPPELCIRCLMAALTWQVTGSSLNSGSHLPKSERTHLTAENLGQSAAPLRQRTQAEAWPTHPPGRGTRARSKPPNGASQKPQVSSSPPTKSHSGNAQRRVCQRLQHPGGRDRDGVLGVHDPGSRGPGEDLVLRVGRGLGCLVRQKACPFLSSAAAPKLGPPFPGMWAPVPSPPPHKWPA